MATITASKFNRAPANGDYGDANVFTSSATLAAAAIGDVIDFAKMPAGCEIIDVQLVNDALGASVTLNSGYRFINPDNGAAAPAAFQAAAGKSSAGKTSGVFHPVTFNDPISITSTVAGAAATGKVTAIITYRFIGTM
jgi:hypothetical protein